MEWEGTGGGTETQYTKILDATILSFGNLSRIAAGCCKTLDTKIFSLRNFVHCQCINVTNNKAIHLMLTCPGTDTSPILLPPLLSFFPFLSSSSCSFPIFAARIWCLKRRSTAAQARSAKSEGSKEVGVTLPDHGFGHRSADLCGGAI